MRRREAVRLFREISECIPDAFISSISLIPNNRLEKEYSLRINVSLNTKSKQKILALLGKRGMDLKEDQGSILIYESELHCLELPVAV